MTREEAIELIPLIQAFADGKTIEFFQQGEWVELNDPDFTWSAHKYRIKPEPKYRPFKDNKECWNEMLQHQSFGWISDGYYKSTISVKPNSIVVTISSEEYSYTDSFSTFKFIDGTPFGIKEE